ncbi:MAG: flagellin [Pseudorhizobium sp.]
MSSILTNTSSMVALDTLRNINRSLEGVQSEISTGKKVNNAKDNAAVWAISTVMSTDVASFKKIQESLNGGSATVGVARSAAETVTSLVQDMKDLIVSAQQDLNDGDRSRIQTDVDAKIKQIGNIINAAQFNGVNLLEGTEDFNILASLDRGSDGTVSATNIAINRQDLTSSAGVYGNGATLAGNITSSAASVDSAGTANALTLTFAGTATNNFALNVNGSSISVAFDTDAATTATNIRSAINQLGLTGITAGGSGAAIELTNTNSFEAFDVTWDTNGANTIAITNAGDTSENAAAAAGSGSATLVYRAEEVALSNSAKVNEGDSYRVAVNGNNYDYIAGKGETMEDVARGLKTAVDGGGETGVSTKVSLDGGQWKVLVDYDGTDTTAGATMTLADAGQADGTASGGLFGLDNIDVSSKAGATAALTNVETLLANTIGAASKFGSAQKQIESQGMFVQSLVDSLTTGIGAMVDADMEAASAKLQALQVQQQLGVQSLSIANQAPQSLLSLFR